MTKLCFFGLNSQTWGPGFNKIILSDKTPQFFNFAMIGTYQTISLIPIFMEN